MQTGGEADRRRSRGTTVVAALVTSAALFCVLFSLLTEDAFTAPALLSDSDEEEDCGGYMSFWLCPKVVDPNCECAWTSEYACPLDLERLDQDGNGHLDVLEAQDLNEDGVVTAAEQAQADENHDGRATKQEALDTNEPLIPFCWSISDEQAALLFVQIC